MKTNFNVYSHVALGSIHTEEQSKVLLDRSFQNNEDVYRAKYILQPCPQ